MAKQIEGVYDRILECARTEFLENGYTDASLRTIASAAGTSTNSIYVRFRDKEGLFCAIVEPVVNGMTQRFIEIQERFHQMDGEEQSEEMIDYAQDGMKTLVDYMYDHFDEFLLLLDASHGTRFHNFVDELVRIEVDYTYKYMEATGYPRKIGDALTENLLHLVTTAYFEGIFEVIRHGMSREEAQEYIVLLGKYHHTGFEAIFSRE
ncbi:MAG: TetR/AcrR family transcriptional regulator [Lachnospiraceae bacterium]|nr:TetR/AcrR family transcriptional regulator [Lachnospiraceae bacterium]